MSAGPLDGLTILDLSRVLAGPFATMRLADLGARVIKIESLDGDPTRGFGPPFVNGESPYFLAVNRGKESVSIDLRHPSANLVLQRLAARADVIVHNFRPGIMEKLGLDRSTLDRLNPRRIECMITGYGPGDPRDGRPAFDLAIQGESGLMNITGDADRPGNRVGISLADIAAGTAAVEGILAALVRRGIDGQGHDLRIALIESLAAFFGYQAQTPLLTGEEPKRLGSSHPNLVPYQAFETADGVIILAVAVDSQWAALARINEMPAELARADWRENKNRVVDRNEIVDLLSAVFRSRPSKEWEHLLDAADIPWGRVNTVNTMLKEMAPGFLLMRDHARIGRLPMIGTPIVIDGNRWTSPHAPPILGADTERILREFAQTSVEADTWCRALLRPDLKEPPK